MSDESKMDIVRDLVIKIDDVRTVDSVDDVDSWDTSKPMRLSVEYKKVAKTPLVAVDTPRYSDMDVMTAAMGFMTHALTTTTMDSSITDSLKAFSQLNRELFITFARSLLGREGITESDKLQLKMVLSYAEGKSGSVEGKCSCSSCKDLGDSEDIEVPPTDPSVPKGTDNIEMDSMGETLGFSPKGLINDAMTNRIKQDKDSKGN